MPVLSLEGPGLCKAPANKLPITTRTLNGPLAERLKRGPLSLGETLDVCRQVAAALEAVHKGAPEPSGAGHHPFDA